MNIRIDNERQLKTAQEFVEFIKEHNRRAMANRNRERDNEDIYDIAVRQASLINEMAKALAVKQTEIEGLRKDLQEFKGKIEELEQEIRVSKDLLEIANNISR